MCVIIQKLSVEAEIQYGLVAQLGERTVRIREVRGFDPLRVHHKRTAILIELPSFSFCAMIKAWIKLAVFRVGG